MLENVSIKRKLVLINLTVAGLALSLVGAFVLFDQYRSMKGNLLDNLHLQARMIANNSTAALLFDDRKVGNEIISALKFSPSVTSASIRNLQGELFAEYRTAEAEQAEREDYEVVSEPVVMNRERIGTIRIESDLNPLWRSLKRQALVMAGIVIAVFAFVWLLLSRLHLAITGPLLELTRLMRQVSDNKAYSLRATVMGRDEIGTLARDFNEMLEQIQLRDEELEQHKLGLERLVGQRTEQLEHMASHDILTGLPNRQLLMDRLTQAINQAERSKQIVAVLFIDLDHFKEINDTLGHDAGDRFLRGIADLAQASLRKGDTVARLGGDEFVVVLLGLSQPGEVDSAASRILSALAMPVQVGDEEIRLGASIGISLYPQDGDNGELLLRNADTAMYRAKEVGRNNYQYYTEELNKRLVERTTLQAELRHAIDSEEFVLYYQPQLDLASGRILAMEALIRWQHPSRGLLSPIHFIGLAEETGLIVPIGAWVLREACRQLRSWHDSGLPRLRVAVNLAVRQVTEDGLVELVRDTLAASGLAGEYLELELTETDVMSNPESVAKTFQRLHDMRVTLAIDDFGMGYSSLSYLKRFPFDRLKIDQSFVRNVISDPDDAAITRTIIAIAHSLGMAVIAEGVETESVLAYLRRHGCHEVQGYLVSPPLPPAEFEKLLHSSLSEPLFLTQEGPQRETLLIVDDDVNALRSMERSLRHERYQVLTTTSVAAAFELMAMHTIQVLIVDHRMPEMGGIDFLVRVKEMYPDTVRIILTGYPEPATISDAINRGGIYRFLTKPLDDSLLRHEVADAFELFRSKA